MIPETVPQVEPHRQVILTSAEQNQEQLWRQLLANSIRSPLELLQSLEFSKQQIQQMLANDQGFATLVTKNFVARMVKANAQDPLLMQVLPSKFEAIAAPDFVMDPLQEQGFSRGKSVLQKYAGRALVIAASHCAINCRYCFRRHFPYNEQQSTRSEWRNSLATIANDPSVTEIILSGGDPLAQTNTSLFNLLDEIERLPQITRLRIHSRLPIVLPQRITSALCRRLQQSPLQVIMVIHCNHHQEVDDTVHNACQSLKLAQVTLLNQSVLLARVNDNADCLKKLSLRLFDIGVLPYYLHLPDKVAGTTHFYVSRERSQRLLAELQTMLPGYLVPRFTIEEPGKSSKTFISAS